MASLAPEARSLEAAPACRNCGTPASGDFCPRCGQETKVELPPAPQFLKEAAGRYVTFDGRLWRTLVPLFVHPGFLTREYLEGRRKRYIRPARLFLVLSLALFAVLRLFVGAPDVLDEAGRTEGAGSTSVPAVPSIDLPEFAIRLDDNANLAIEAPDGPLLREVNRRLARFNALSRQDKADQLFTGAMRYGPYAMFVLLPACALLFQLAYLGRGKRYPGRPRRYAEHLVFAAHNHAFMALLVAVAAVIAWPPAVALLALWSIIYGIWSAKVVYRGRWSGVFARAFVIAIMYFALFVIVTLGLVVAALVLG